MVQLIKNMNLGQVDLSNKYGIIKGEGKLEKIIQFIKDWFQKMTDGQKHRLALFCTFVFAGVLTLSVIFSLKANNEVKKEEKEKKDKKEIKHEEPVVYAPIPPEELFLPDEPDYIPGVLLNRDRRTNWTEEDAMEYWQDPLKDGEEQWREKIESSIDEYLERVP